MAEQTARLRRRAVSFAVLALWLVVATAAASIVTSWHYAALPAQVRQTSIHGRGGWSIRHYLSTDCTCSRAIAEYLVARGPFGETNEEVVWVQSRESRAVVAFERKLRKRGFSVVRVNADQAAEELDIVGVPVLEVMFNGSTLYRGGYRKRGAGSDYQDRAIVSGLKMSKSVPRLPVYGCATSEALRSRLDPFGFKRLSTSER